MQGKALRSVVMLFEPVLMVGIYYHLNGLGGKRSVLSTLSHLIYSFGKRNHMCKVSKSKLETICTKVKCWTRKQLKIFTFFGTFSHLLGKSKNSTCLKAELEWIKFPSTSTHTLTNITPLLACWVHFGSLSGLLILIPQKSESLTGWSEQETCLTGWMNLSYGR